MTAPHQTYYCAMCKGVHCTFTCQGCADRLGEHPTKDEEDS